MRSTSYQIMKENSVSAVVPFQKIPAAAKTTGLSQYFLRSGCRDGSIPHVRSGTVYLVNIPALLRKLEAESVGGGGPVPELQEREGVKS